MAPIMIQMLRMRKEYHFGRGDLISFRIWNALLPTVMKGLPSDDIPSLPQSVAGFLKQNQFANPDDEMNGSGFTPLVFAAMSGNVVVVKELLAHSHVNVHARTSIDLPKYSIEKGMDALTLSLGTCPEAKVREMVVLLLGAGADPNSASPM